MKTIGNVHCAGTYLIKAGNIPIYIGQANDISDRFFSPRFSHVTKMNELRQQVKEQGTRFFELKPGQYKYAIMYRLWDNLTLEKVGERDEEAELIQFYKPIFNCDLKKIDSNHLIRFNDLSKLSKSDVRKILDMSITDEEIAELQQRLIDIRPITLLHRN